MCGERGVADGKARIRGKVYRLGEARNVARCAGRWGLGDSPSEGNPACGWEPKSPVGE